MAYSGIYKGITFRSLLELSVIKHLEKEGFVLNKTMLYETTVVKYGNSKKRNYIVDLTLPEIKTLVEIKPSSRANNRNNFAKRLGAEEWCKQNGWSYVIITEEELRACGEILTLEQVAKIDDVKLNERALRALRRKISKKKRETIRGKR